MRHPRLDDERGFTLVELMVAATVLLIGMLAVVGMLTTGLKKTGLNSQRVAATNFARELTEAARVADYDKLTPANLESVLVAADPNLGGGSPWKAQRRNTVYTITASVCSYDDPADKLSTNAPPITACPAAPGTPVATGDANGDDFRRVTFTVSWTFRTQPQSYTQSALIVNPSGGLGPRIISSPFPSTMAPASPINGTDTSVSFSFASTWAAAMHWNADDGTSAGNAVGGPTFWTVTWPLGTAGSPTGVLDGTYVVSVQGFDDRNIAGDTKVASITLNRARPFAPAGLAGGHDTRLVADWVDLEWPLNAERDIIGYRVYRAGADGAPGGGDDSLACPAVAGTWLPNTATTCQDFTPPSGASTYYVVALDRDPSNTPRQGTPTLLSIGAAGSRPGTPNAAGISGTSPPTLSWSAPASGTVAFYRVYRDGATPADRIGKLTGSTYVDSGGDDGHTHFYYVSAVDSSYNESDLVGPFFWNP